jgi:hypothetical protein
MDRVARGAREPRSHALLVSRMLIARHY